MERSKNRQLAFNMIASYIAMGFSLGITFFLTPYIVGELGREAYGYIALSSNLIGYSSLVTIALNAMASRFISIKFIEGNINEANQYYSSVFFSNIILSIVITIVMLIVIAFVNHILDVPDFLLSDVRVLLLLLSTSSVIGLVTGTFGVGTFIKNRIDISSSRNIIGNLLSSLLIVVLFSLLSPHIWYMGVSGLVCTLYMAITNKILLTRLTPELSISKSLFDIRKVWELIKSGAWNVLNKLSEILGQGLDLLMANIFIGALAMGTFSITKNIPFLILSLNATASSVFAPIFTKLYAEKRKGDLIAELNKSIRLLGCISCITLVCCGVFVEDFYSLWLPGQDSDLLAKLTLVGLLACPFTLPNEPLWNIFTITNRLKYSSLFMLFNNCVVFLIVIISMFVVNNDVTRLFILAGTRACIGIIRGFSFLPIYGAYCLQSKATTFYKPMLKSLLCILVSGVMCSNLRLLFNIQSWGELIFILFVSILICLFVCSLIILQKSDRAFLCNKVKLMIVRKK